MSGRSKSFSHTLPVCLVTMGSSLYEEKYLTAKFLHFVFPFYIWLNEIFDNRFFCDFSWCFCNGTNHIMRNFCTRKNMPEPDMANIGINLY